MGKFKNCKWRIVYSSHNDNPLSDFNPFFDTLQSWGRGLWPIAVIWLLNSTNSIKYICFWVQYWLCWSLELLLSEISEFHFYLDNENEEFIINEGIFNKTIIQLNRINK
jgi:putative membrane protein